MKHVLIVIAILITTFSAKAQYSGGSGDGHAMAEVKSVALSVPGGGREADLNISPNPAALNSTVNISLPEMYLAEAEAFFGDAIYVTDLAGKVIYSEKFQLGQKAIKLHLLPKHFSEGAYMVKIGQSGFAKLVVY